MKQIANIIVHSICTIKRDNADIDDWFDVGSVWIMSCQVIQDVSKKCEKCKVNGTETNLFNWNEKVTPILIQIEQVCLWTMPEIYIEQLKWNPKFWSEIVTHDYLLSVLIAKCFEILGLN